ncbi:MAG: ATP-binding protein [Gammaproteobacteria bacterium]|nr:ATP-binding protein [Gammaproteobacteria bacterium]
MSDDHKTTQQIRNRIDELCQALKLNKIREILDAELDRALAEKVTGAQLLVRLLTAEADAKMQRRIERRITESKLPVRKLLCDYDFGFQTGVDEVQIRTLAQMDFVTRRQSVIFGGYSGTGKSHLAMALLLTGCGQGLRCFYTTGADMLRYLKSGLVDDTLHLKLKRYLLPDLLLIDEVGFDRLEQEDTRPASLFFKVIDGRYGKKSTMMTTNLSFKELGDYLGDPIVTTAIVDRLVHHAVIINIDGPSWRMHQSEQLNGKPSQTSDP